MKYKFEFDFHTDGDYGFDFIPHGMIYDGFEQYSFEKTYTDKEEAIADINMICTFLVAYVKCADCKKGYFEDAIDSFMNKLRHIKIDETEFCISEEMDGNYEFTEFRFYSEPQTLNFSIAFSNEEIELLNGNANKLNSEKVKKAILDLVK